MSGLPSCAQSWSHGTNTFEKCSDAIRDPVVTAIEADIVMGRDLLSPLETPNVPVMSHPPHLESDLSVATFLDLVTKGGSDEANEARSLSKHIKLDFKHFEAVAPTLRIFKRLDANRNGKTVFLNADVLAGPGKSSVDVTVPADEFIHTCMELFSGANAQLLSKGHSYAFSLGFKVEIHNPFGHTDDHLQEMASLVKRHDLAGRCAGVVLAINARLLYKNTAPFERFLLEFPSAQILVWTGSTEPPISSRKVDFIKNQFIASGHSHLVGFDCNVAETLLLGLVWDLAVDLYGFFMLISKVLGIAPASKKKSQERLSGSGSSKNLQRGRLRKATYKPN